MTTVFDAVLYTTVWDDFLFVSPCFDVQELYCLCALFFLHVRWQSDCTLFFVPKKFTLFLCASFWHFESASPFGFYFAFVISPCVRCTVLSWAGKEISFPFFPLVDVFELFEYFLRLEIYRVCYSAKLDGRADLICRPRFSGIVELRWLCSFTPLRKSFERLTQVRMPLVRAFLPSGGG